MKAVHTFLAFALSLLLAATRLTAEDRKPGPVLESLWEDLAGRDAAQAYRAVWSLTDAGDRAVRFLNGRLRPDAGDPESIRRLIAELERMRDAWDRRGTGTP